MIRDVEFTGTAVLDDIPVRRGIEIVAKIDSRPIGSAEVKNGRYTLIIRKDQVELFVGQEINFKIGHFEAVETVILEFDGGRELNLTGTIYFTP